MRHTVWIAGHEGLEKLLSNVSDNDNENCTYLCMSQKFSYIVTTRNDKNAIFCVLYPSSLD